MTLSCRFYKKHLPNIDEIIMVNVRELEEIGTYVKLLEYNDIEGDF